MNKNKNIKLGQTVLHPTEYIYSFGQLPDLLRGQVVSYGKYGDNPGVSEVTGRPRPLVCLVYWENGSESYILANLL